MKKLLLLIPIVLILFLCLACSNKMIKLETDNIENADINYGYVNHAIIHVDADTAKDLVNRFS